MPDLGDRSALLAAARDLTPYTPSSPRRRWRPSRTVLVAGVAVAIVLTVVGWHRLTRHHDSPVTAVTTLATLAGNGDWPGVYAHLCAADRRQFSAADVATGGSGALQLLHGFAGVRITGGRSATVHLIGPIRQPAEQVTAQLLPVVGPPVAFTVTTVRELSGWRVCLSIGGYSAPAFGVDVPLGHG